MTQAIKINDSTHEPESLVVQPTDGNMPSNDKKSLPSRHWLAELSLSFKLRGTKTTLSRIKHLGPLRVQRPFYPEDDCCHVYLLHPPGGIAAGDKLSIEFNAEHSTRVLLTTPSAGKVYGSDEQSSPQRQVVRGSLAKGSCLEWFPQETIIFSGAEINLETHFDLGEDAKLCGWDILCLGRRASGERFENGNCTQLITVTKNSQTLMRERMQLRGGEQSLQSPWGLGGNVVVGTFYATISASRQQIDDWRQALAELEQSGEWGISQKPNLFLARYLGQSAAQAKSGFELLWKCLRPDLNGRVACRPRIWNT